MDPIYLLVPAIMYTYSLSVCTSAYQYVYQPIIFETILETIANTIDPSMAVSVSVNIMPVWNVDSASSEAKCRHKILIAKALNPKVRIVIGKLSACKIGRIEAFTNARKSANTTTAIAVLSPTT